MSAYLSDRDDGNAGTKLTVTWTDDQTCATKYQVAQFIPAPISTWAIITPNGRDLASTATMMTYYSDHVVDSAQIRVICGPKGSIDDLQNSRLIGDVTATR